SHHNLDWGSLLAVKRSSVETMPFTRAHDRKGVIAMVQDLMPLTDECPQVHQSAKGSRRLCRAAQRAPKMAYEHHLPNSTDQSGDRVIAHRLFSSRCKNACSSRTREAMM